MPYTSTMKTTTTFLILLTLFSLISLPTSTTASQNVSAVFAFGDSTVDTGNNNCLNTLFRSDHLPYGCDFPRHFPSGRFSNGKIGTDYLVQMLGIKDLLPAYLDPRVTDYDLLTGVSFGSGGSGLDRKTVAMSRVMDLNREFELFEGCLMRIRRVVGEERANHIVENALFVISTGSNDMLFNAYLFPGRMLSFGSISHYQDFLLQNLLHFVQRLYGAGARRILVAGLPPIGCLPLQVTLSSIAPSKNSLHRVCNSQQNIDSQAYNMNLQSYIQVLQTTLHGAKVAYLDIYTPLLDMVLYPTKYGCCGTGLLEMGPVCNVLDPTCKDPSIYLFWDAVHLTEAGNWFIAENGRRNVLPYFTG